MDFLFQEPYNVREYFGLQIKGKSKESFGIVTSLPYVVSASMEMFIEYWKEQDFQCLDVLELGAGTGVLGIYLARHRGIKSILITDGDEEAINVIQENIDTNECSERASTTQYLWGATMLDQYPLILAADVIYDKAHVDSLFTSIAFALTPEGTCYIGNSQARFGVWREEVELACEKYGLEFQCIDLDDRTIVLKIKLS